MIDYKKLKTPDEVHSALNAFEVCFPHLKEKVSDMWQFACKLSQKAEVYVGYEGERLVGISCFYITVRKICLYHSGFLLTDFLKHFSAFNHKSILLFSLFPFF